MFENIKKLLGFKKIRKVIIPSRRSDTKLARSISSKRYIEMDKEIKDRLTIPKFVSPYEIIQKAQLVMETASLSLEEKKTKLDEIEATSEWSAYYDLQAFPPKESYEENESLFVMVPYFKAGMFLRAEMSVGVGIDDIKDPKSKEETPQERYVKEEFDRLDVEKILSKTCLHRDLYGNSYWYKEWDIEPTTGQRTLKHITVIQPKRVRIRLSREVGNKKIGYAYLPPILVPGTFPMPIALELSDIIQFKGEDYDEIPYGYSKVKAIRTILESRREVNILEPIIYKHYTKPWIHWKLTSEGLSDIQVSNYQSDMETAMKEAGPESDMITTDRWEASVMSGSQAKDGNLVKNLIEDIDNQIFGELKVPETYFKAKGSTDRMILRQDDNFMREMGRIQNYFSWIIKEELIKPLLENKFGSRVQNEQGEWSYQIPEIIWNSVLIDDKFKVNEDLRADLQAGIKTINEVRKEKGLEELPSPPSVIQNTTPIPTQEQTAPTPMQEVSTKRHVIEDNDVKLVIEEK